MPETVETRFWNKVNKNGPTPEKFPHLGPCWIWIGKTKSDSGYGICWSIELQKEQRAHRVSWEIHFGEIPDKLHVCHHCDNPPCVNPSHLFLGTNLQNMLDARDKGRLEPQRQAALKMWETEWKHTHVGEKAVTAKLTEAQVLELRRLYVPGKLGTHKLAKLFGICQQSCHEIVSGKTWKHLIVRTAPPDTDDAVQSTASPQSDQLNHP